MGTEHVTRKIISEIESNKFFVNYIEGLNPEKRIACNYPFFLLKLIVDIKSKGASAADLFENNSVIYSKDIDTMMWLFDEYLRDKLENESDQSETLISITHLEKLRKKDYIDLIGPGLLFYQTKKSSYHHR